MRRITSACLEQTIRFDVMPGADPELELKYYLEQLKMRRTKFELVSKEVRSDGNLYIKIKKQYINYSTAEYID